MSIEQRVEAIRESLKTETDPVARNVGRGIVDGYERSRAKSAARPGERERVTLSAEPRTYDGARPYMTVGAHGASIPSGVSLHCQTAAGACFGFVLTPDEARELSAALVRKADETEAEHEPE